VINSFARFFEYFSDRFSAVFVMYAKKRWKLRLIILTVFILSIVLLLGWMSSKKVREVVIQDFNLQQLVLARHAARQTENFLQIIEREMNLLSRHPFFQTPEPSFLKWQLLLSYTLLADEGLSEIRFFDAVGNRTYRVIPNGGGFSTGRPSAEDLEFLDSTRQLYGDNIFHFSSRHSAMPETKGRRTLLYIAKPIYASTGTSKRVRETSRMRGVLIYVVDAMTVAEQILRDIRSGKTGYAWMIDSNGDFLYHHESSFTGRNAFEARKEKDPKLSYMLIEDIQRKKMLKGEEGTGWYLSGWHLGVQGNIKKLIAFSPISIAAAPNSLVWSVAVVAPMSEVEGAIEAIQFRQYLLEGIIIIFILLGSFLTFTAMAKWSSTLKDEVSRKTDELLQSENQYASLVEHANDIIYTVDRNANFLTINKAGTEFFKMDRKDIIGQNIGTICFNEEGASRQFKAIDEVFATGESREIVYSLNINNAEIWVSTSYSLTSGKGGANSAVLGISRDVTERKRREDQMYHTEKLASLGTLAAGVAHEINNPLAVILGFTDMLLGKTPTESEAYDILKTIEKQGNNAKRVVENLLSFARYRDSREELIEINNNIEEVLTVAGNTLRVSKIVVQKQLAKDLPAIKGDSRELQQVFLNIINNAIYAMKGHGILTVTTGRTANGKVEIRLADTGHGIKKEDRNKIFDPLFTTKEVGEGTGLGLSVCYAIVAKYGGTISFETRTADESPEALGRVDLDDSSTVVDLSTADGKPLTGTTFIITLPVVKD
jgi:two-component system, NtrC family, sensor kinase